MRINYLSMCEPKYLIQTPITRPPFGLKDVLKAEGPEGFAKAVR